MIEKVKLYIESNNLLSKNKQILVAVSGGADSIVLLHILYVLRYDVVVAHCNFGLRGAESDSDELFVKDICNKYELKSHFISFNTKKHAKDNGLSIEMAARELRYDWFNFLCKQNDYSKIVTGHHLNDSIETFFLNLIRGTGINGLTGISAINGNVVRPLLKITRKEIEEFIFINKLKFINDSSNSSLIYTRNIIRNKIIPILKDINPAFADTMFQNINILNDVANIFNRQIDIKKSEILIEDDGVIKIHINKLLELNPIKTYLFEFIYPFGFGIGVINNIISVIRKPGRVFESNTHKVLIDRDFLIVKKRDKQDKEFVINNIKDFEKIPVGITAKQQEANGFNIIKDSAIACLDVDKLVFPLRLRKWQKGDYFFPLGMVNKQKLSDFFINQKIDRFKKEDIWILEHNNNIVWVVGVRIDNRYKVSIDTKTVLILTKLIYKFIDTK